MKAHNLQNPCHLCNKNAPQTNKHVLSNRSAPVALQRYTKRHDDILNILVNWFKTVLPQSSKIYADIINCNCLPICDLFQNFRPDVAIYNSDALNILELTVCHETNMLKSKEYKQN